MDDLISRQVAIDLWEKYHPIIAVNAMQYDAELRQLPSAQFKGINKGIHEITESDKISYAIICDKFPSPHVYFDTYDEAEHWARFNQPNYRPYYIIERSEHFEIVGEVR